MLEPQEGEKNLLGPEILKPGKVSQTPILKERGKKPFKPQIILTPPSHGLEIWWERI